MDSTIEKLSNEIESLEGNIKSYKNNLEEYRQELREKQSQLKELHKQEQELGIQMQKIQERSVKKQQQIKEHIEIVQNAERYLSSSQEKFLSKQNELQQKKGEMNSIQIENERYLKTIVGSLYAKFLSEYPQYKNKNRWSTEEWGNYLLSHAEAFRGKCEAFKQSETPSLNDQVQKTVELYNADAKKKGSYSVARCKDLIKENHGEEASRNWHLKRSIPLHFAEFPKFVFQPPCTNAVREARVSQLETYYENCYNWFESNKQKIKEAKENVDSTERDAKKRDEEERKALEEGVQNTKVFQEYILAQLLEKLGNTLKREEAEAILGKYYEPQEIKGTTVDVRHPYLSKNVFKQDSLLALKVCNRFAEQNQIRVEDAMSLFKEYAAIKYILPNQNQNRNNTRTYIRDVNC